MKKILVILVMAGLMMSLSAKAEAILLGSYDISRQGLAGSPGAAGVVFGTQAVDAGGVIVPNSEILGGISGGIVYTPTDVGSTFVFNSGNNANFNNFTANLNDGILERIQISLFLSNITAGFNASPFENDASIFGGDPGLLNGIDFAGFSIDSISLSISQLSPTTVTNPSTGGVFFGFDVAATVSVEGTRQTGAAVPEPTSMLLFGTGLVGAAIRRKFSA